MEVAVKPDAQQATGTDSDRLRSLGEAAFDGMGVTITEETKDRLRQDAWDQFGNASESFCANIPGLPSEYPDGLDRETIRAWADQARKLRGATETLLAIHTDTAQAGGEGSQPGS